MNLNALNYRFERPVLWFTFSVFPGQQVLSVDTSVYTPAVMNVNRSRIIIAHGPEALVLWL